MMPSSPPPADGCSPKPNGDLPGRRLLGRTAGADGLWTGVPPTGRHYPERCAEPEPTDHGGLRPADEQSSVGGRAWKRAVGCSDDWPAERLGRECDTGRRPRPGASRRKNGSDLVGQTQSAIGRHRHRPWPLGPPATSCPTMQPPSASGTRRKCLLCPDPVSVQDPCAAAVSCPPRQETSPSAATRDAAARPNSGTAATIAEHARSGGNPTTMGPSLSCAFRQGANRRDFPPEPTGFRQFAW